MLLCTTNLPFLSKSEVESELNTEYPSVKLRHCTERKLWTRFHCALG